MAIKLYEHNRVAYKTAKALLEREGKAAIVHPTGTGKSFIAFKLCEENPDKKILWLSPSEYIFKTQIENLKSTSEGYTPDNITFYTYAKLTYLSDSEIEEIKPEYIILDEFHRCGAEVWGKGVQKILRTYADIPVLGLSATNIRYLDNQRDMAEELFEGNIASEMTLGEAIVRGILNPPKYVLSVFQYQKDLEKYSYRVKHAKNKAVRDAGEKYLEALRRALDKADGLPEIFEKHMENKRGKYIVFCANVEHMEEMTGYAEEWFGGIDGNPHIYKAYSDDPETSKAFENFKKDESDHLKLLYCIDMLNEGVHVDDVSGVILLRPTVSPIIYKQQIGRALSASKMTKAVIFDIVMNIDNLYSIGTIEDEMQVVMTYYRERGLENEIVNEYFKIIDEVRDCVQLFEKLNDTLAASWEYMFGEAKRYYEKNGNLEVPKKYKTEQGYSLGSWLTTQRNVRRGEQFGILGRERIEKLDSIGMRWESSRDISWEKNYAAAKDYFKQYNNLLPSVTDKAYRGVKLGRWVAQLRSYRKSGICRAYLTDERIKLLDEIGMVWDVPDYLFEKNYEALLAYYREKGNVNVPSYYVTREGLRLGAWVSNIRNRKNNIGKGAELTIEQIKRLDELGFSWEGRFKNIWNKEYEAACDYKAKHGDLNIPVMYVTEDGLALGRWIRRQIDTAEKLSTEKREKLLALGVSFEKTDTWKKKFELLEQYYEEHGDLKIPSDYVVEGVWLGRWFSEQKARLNGKSIGKNGTKKTLNEEQEKKLLSLGVQKSVTNSDISWQEQYTCAKEFFKENGHLNIPKNYISKNGKSVGRWLAIQRGSKYTGKLDAKRIALLEDIGMTWSYDNPWEIGFKYAKSYFKKNGDLLVKGDFVTDDGYALGKWIQNQRSAYKGTARKGLTEEQKKRLDNIGFVPDVNEYKWNCAYERAVRYYRENGTVKVPRGYEIDGIDLQIWIAEQRRALKNGKLTSIQLRKLSQIGVCG